MTKISQYSIDVNITGNDKWIGSDAQNFLITKNFTPNNLASFFNGNNVIDIGTSIRYRYQTLDPGEAREQGTISFETEIGPQVNFSSITTFLIAKNTLKGNTVSQYLDFLVDGNVLLSKASNINIFGYYKITSLEPWIPNPNFFVVEVDFISGNGFIFEDLDYLVSLVDKVSGSGDAVWGSITGDIEDQTDLINYISSQIPTYTVNNGITESPDNNFQLGGALTKNTTIDNSTFDFIFTGTKSDREYILDVQNTSTGNAIKAEAGTDGMAIKAISTDGPAISARSTNNTPFYGATTNGQAASFQSTNGGGIALVSNSLSNFALTGGTGTSIDTILKLRKFNPFSGSVGIGNGLAIDIYAGLNNIGGDPLTSKIASVYENVTSLNESAALDFSTIGSGTLSRKMSVKGTGQLQLDKYIGTTFDASPTKSLGVDASGNVITFTGGGGSGTVTSVGLTMPSAFTITPGTSPITTSGTIAVTGAGSVSQYIRGDGTLATFPTIPTVGTWGALNYPTWTTGTPFVKMTAVGTFALDTNTYLTDAPSDGVTYGRKNGTWSATSTSVGFEQNFLLMGA